MKRALCIMKIVAPKITLVVLAAALSACGGGFGPVRSAANAEGRPQPTTSIGYAGQYNSISAAESQAALTTACARMGMVPGSDSASIETHTDIETTRESRGPYGSQQYARTETRSDRRVGCVNPNLFRF